MATGAALKILILDDMPAMRAILRNMLEEAGYRRIMEAEDAESAWKLVRQAAVEREEAFGLVISDWQLPGASGMELLRSVRGYAGTRGLPFIMVTAKGNDACINEALRAGVTDYLVKPFSADQLVGKIRTLS